jgi:hypothetical protein
VRVQQRSLVLGLRVLVRVQQCLLGLGLGLRVQVRVQQRSLGLGLLVLVLVQVRLGLHMGAYMGGQPP